MALIKCPECGRNNVSSTAESCPDCGYGIRRHFEGLKWEEKERQLVQEKQRRTLEEKCLEEMKRQMLREEITNNVAMPQKPELPIIGMLVGVFVCFLGFAYLISASESLILGWLCVIAGIIPIIASIQSYLKCDAEYRLAEKDFDAYRRIIVEKQEKIALQESIKKKENDYERQMNVPKCPTCGSTKIEKISGLSKAGSVLLWGVYAAGRTSKQWHCNNCGSEW